MIVTLLINLVIMIFGVLFVFLPIVHLPDVVNSTLISATQIWNTFLETLPYARLPWHLFLYVILPFELLLLLAKFFLGHRLPAHLN